MTGCGVSDDDMPDYSWRASDTTPLVGDGALDALLAAGPSAPDTASALRPVARVLAALQAGPSGDELAGKPQALAEFRRTVGVSRQSRRMLPRRPAMLRARLSGKLAAAGAVAAAVAVGGAAAAAYAGALPASLQTMAHEFIAAPAASAAPPRPAHRAAGTGPAVAGSSRYGLCTAYEHARVHHNAIQRSVAFRNLVRAASGSGSVASFCSTVLHPGASSGRPPAQTGKPAGHAPVNPGGYPRGKPVGHAHGHSAGHGPRQPATPNGGPGAPGKSAGSRHATYPRKGRL